MSHLFIKQYDVVWYSWANTNNMKFNSKKFQYINFSMYPEDKDSITQYVLDGILTLLNQCFKM